MNYPSILPFSLIIEHQLCGYLPICQVLFPCQLLPNQMPLTSTMVSPQHKLPSSLIQTSADTMRALNTSNHLQIPKPFNQHISLTLNSYYLNQMQQCLLISISKYVKGCQHNSSLLVTKIGQKSEISICANQTREERPL